VENDRIIDIGCGTVASTLAAAAITPQGHMLGVDISAPLLDRARSRASTDGIANAPFFKADAQSHGFQKDAFDVVVSRLNMMFFADPVQEFQNLLHSLRPGGRMAYVAWAGVA
jgi:ubiquinone/menaquinone biosynthesis C-methylase UbiE